MSPDLIDGNDYYQAFANCEDALQFSITTPGAEKPLALILQNEYIDEPAPGIYIHKKEKRMTEWPMEFLNRPKRDGLTILNFFAPDAPLNRLDIIRGII